METLEHGTRVLREAAMGVVWRQWRALGWSGPAGTRRQALSQVDPEALLLVSLGLVDRERTLAGVLNWWAVAGARLVSVQRTKNLVESYAEPVRFRLREFAAHARREGGDFRWRSLAGKTATAPVEERSTSAAFLMTAAALPCRLRLGLGVGVKADVVSYLLGAAGAWASVRTLARATSYTNRSVRRGAEELARAKLLHASESSPVEYQVDPEPWLALLGLDAAPRWQPWQGAFAMVTEAVDVVERDARRDPKWMLRRLAAAVDRHRDAFTRARIRLPETPDADRYAEAMAELGARLEKQV